MKRCNLDKVSKKVPSDGPSFAGPYLTVMRRDAYFAPELVDAIEGELTKLVTFLDTGERTTDELQAQGDTLTEALNEHEDSL